MTGSDVRYSPLIDRIHSDGADGWEVHAKAMAAVARGEEAIVLSVGDPDFDTPTPVVDRAVAALRDGDTHYSNIPGREHVRAAVAQVMATQTGLDLTAGNVIISAGTQGALIGASLCLLGSGDEVISLDPMYLTYEATLCVGGATMVRVGQPASTGFRPDVAAIEAAITERTRAIAITTPNNPTGVVMTRAELDGIAALAMAHNLWVIADEVYGGLVFDGEHVSIASLPGMAERTVTVSSLSKSHAMTGWRIGWAVGPETLIDHMDALQLNVNYGVPGFIQEAAREALLTCDAESEAMRDAYRRRRNLAVDILSGALDLGILVPEAGMYVLADVSALAGSSRAFANDLFDATNVSVLDAGAFGEAAQGWVRIGFMTSDEELAEGCRRIVHYVNGLQI